jgi:hypothetical protein
MYTLHNVAITGGIKSAHDVLTDERLSREKAYADDVATQHQVPAVVSTSDKDSSTSDKTAASKRSRQDKVPITNKNTKTRTYNSNFWCSACECTMMCTIDC